MGILVSTAISCACNKVSKTEAHGGTGAPQAPQAPQASDAHAAVAVTPERGDGSSAGSANAGSAGSGEPGSAGSASSGIRATPAPSTATAAPLPTDAAALAVATNDFGLRLWRVASGAGNQAISPVSIAAALAMTAGGARGTTAQEMLQALQLKPGTDVVAQLAPWGALQVALVQPGHGNTLHIANRLFGDKAYSFEKAFLDFTANTFAAPLAPVDFRGTPQAQRAFINSWIADQTAGRIKDLLGESDITERTRLVLANAVYFLGKWADGFSAAKTEDAPFWISKDKSVTVPTMHRTGMYATGALGNANVIALPYQGGKLAMWVVVPTAKDGLAAVEKSLTGAMLQNLASNLTSSEVSLSLPRFELAPANALSLVPGLKSLGMKTAFAQVADFSGIAKPANEPGLLISNVVHKAFVKVDEAGTEAAAATAVVMATKGVPAPPTALVVDRPFLFFIVDTRANVVLFMGRVANPAAR